MTIRLMPTEDRIVVKPAEPSDKTKGGILLPDSAKEAKHYGEVVAVGDGKYDDNGDLLPIIVEVGDSVYLSAYHAGEPYKEDGVEYRILRQHEILGVLKPLEFVL